MTTFEIILAFNILFIYALIAHYIKKYKRVKDEINNELESNEAEEHNLWRTKDDSK